MLSVDRRLLDVPRAGARVIARTLDRAEWVIDSSDAATTQGADYVRKAIGLLCAGYAVLLSVEAVRGGDFPSPGYLMMLMLALALFTNRGGRFVRDWVPVFLGLFAYALAGTFSAKLNLATSVHYTPQIDADRLLGFGQLPTLWLQQHLYHGTTGVLEVVSLAFYASHFVVPLVLVFCFWWSGRRAAFHQLLYGLLLVSMMAMITFVLVPTAPPWLAAREGFLAPVHHINRDTIDALGFSAWASWYGDGKVYNIVAAVPSLHVAFPVVGLMVVRRLRLPGWYAVVLAVQLVGVTFSIVYTGEHYLVDALAGVVYALVAAAIVAHATGGEKIPRRIEQLADGRAETATAHSPHADASDWSGSAA